MAASDEVDRIVNAINDISANLERLNKHGGRLELIADLLKNSVDSIEQIASHFEKITDSFERFWAEQDRLPGG
jgi:uncharacterized protein Yka (UPF0111/DUF47 family)